MKISVIFDSEDELKDFLDWREHAQREREAVSQTKQRTYGSEAHLPTLQNDLADAEFTVRTHNVLTKMGVKTIEDIMKFSATELKKQSGFGARSMREVKDFLALYGLRLKP